MSPIHKRQLARTLFHLRRLLMGQRISSAQFWRYTAAVIGEYRS